MKSYICFLIFCNKKKITKNKNSFAVSIHIFKNVKKVNNSSPTFIYICNQ